MELQVHADPGDINHFPFNRFGGTLRTDAEWPKENTLSFVGNLTDIISDRVERRGGRRIGSWAIRSGGNGLTVVIPDEVMMFLSDDDELEYIAQQAAEKTLAPQDSSDEPHEFARDVHEILVIEDAASAEEASTVL